MKQENIINQVPNQITNNGGNVAPKKKKSLVILIAVLVVVIAVIGAILVVLFSNKTIKCTANNTIDGMTSNIELNMNFQNKKFKTLTFKIEVTLSSTYSSEEAEEMYESIKEEFDFNGNSKITKEGRKIIVMINADEDDVDQSLLETKDSTSPENMIKAAEEMGLKCNK